MRPLCLFITPWLAAGAAAQPALPTEFPADAAAVEAAALDRQREGDDGQCLQRVGGLLQRHAGRVCVTASVDRIPELAQQIADLDGVTERRYDEAGTTGTSADDVLLTEDFRPSRLGLIGTDIWSHCWIETSAWPASWANVNTESSVSL